MHKLKSIFFILVLCMAASPAFAGQVTVALPAEEDVSSMALREKAMAKGFAKAVADEAMLMLPGKMGPERSELLKKYYVTNAKPFIQGYKILTSKVSEQGVFVGLDVSVDKRALRKSLKEMGFFVTSLEPVVAAVTYPEEMDEEAMIKLQELMTLTGVQQGEVEYPVFSLEPGPEGTYKARLTTEEQAWDSIQKNLDVAWFNVWTKYFGQAASENTKVGVKELTVAGWFSPDAVLEFDRVLRSWETAVQEIQLLEMDMQSAGVGGTWQLRLLSAERFEMLLRSYLPQRGLTYHLLEEGEE